MKLIYECFENSKLCRSFTLRLHRQRTSTKSDGMIKYDGKTLAARLLVTNGGSVFERVQTISPVHLACDLIRPKQGCMKKLSAGQSKTLSKLGHVETSLKAGKG